MKNVTDEQKAVIQELEAALMDSLHQLCMDFLTVCAEAKLPKKISGAMLSFHMAQGLAFVLTETSTVNSGMAGEMIEAMIERMRKDRTDHPDQSVH